MKWRIYSNEHYRWWRPNRMGYTDNRDEAGIYTTQEASEIIAQASLGGLCDLSDGRMIPNEVMIPETFEEAVQRETEYTRGDNN